MPLLYKHHTISITEQLCRQVDGATLIQPEEVADSVLFVVGAAPAASVTSVTIQAQQQHVAAIRRHTERFLAENPPVLAKY